MRSSRQNGKKAIVVPVFKKNKEELKFVPRNCLRYLQTTLIMGERDWFQNLCEVLSKK